jgi:hypothetical protein
MGVFDFGVVSAFWAPLKVAFKSTFGAWGTIFKAVFCMVVSPLLIKKGRDVNVPARSVVYFL